MFGLTPSASQERWGQFGDFFAGLLNPIFAMLAFLALLWSIERQDRQSQSNTVLLAAQAKVARDELVLLREARDREELLHVIRDIDDRLTILLERVVSPAGATTQLTIEHMVAEAQRIDGDLAKSPSYATFVGLANAPGTVVEASVRELVRLVGVLRQFLELYSESAHGSFAPVIVYYADKVFRLVPMLEDIGGLPADTRKFFATIGDLHG